MRDRKNIEKEVVRMVALAGDAESGKEGLDGWDRPGPARLDHHKGWAGGLFALRVTRRGGLKAWRLGGLEAWRPGEIERWLFCKSRC